MVEKRNLQLAIFKAQVCRSMGYNLSSMGQDNVRDILKIEIDLMKLEYQITLYPKFLATMCLTIRKPKPYTLK